MPIRIHPSYINRSHSRIARSTRTARFGGFFARRGYFRHCSTRLYSHSVIREILREMVLTAFGRVTASTCFPFRKHKIREVSQVFAQIRRFCVANNVIRTFLLRWRNETNSNPKFLGEFSLFDARAVCSNGRHTKFFAKFTNFVGTFARLRCQSIYRHCTKHFRRKNLLFSRKIAKKRRENSELIITRSQNKGE